MLRSESTLPKNLADFTKGRGYMELHNAVLGPVSHTLLPTQTDLIEAKLERVGRKFAECVILSGVNWIFVTQWNIFISNSPLGICAYHVKDHDMTGFEVSIESKKEDKGTWNELIIQNGEYQLLVLGGIICENGNFKPFLGSSIPTTQSSSQREMMGTTS